MRLKPHLEEYIEMYGRRGRDDDLTDAIEYGRREGEANSSVSIARRMLFSDYSESEVSEITGIPIEELPKVIGRRNQKTFRKRTGYRITPFLGKYIKSYSKDYNRFSNKINLDEGRVQGERHMAIEIAKKMKRENYPAKDIAKMTGLSKDQVKRLKI